MKKSVSILAAVVLAVAITSGITKNKEADALGGLLFGQPRDIFFDSHYGSLVSEVHVKVSKGWVGKEKIELDIEIYSKNGGIHHHGRQVVPLSDVEVAESEKGYAIVVVDWTADPEPDFFADLYEVSVQILMSGNPVGDRITIGIVE